MKRRINFENLIVVTVLAIAMSLLASACGPGSMKTLKTNTKTGIHVFTDKGTDTKANVPTEQEKNIQAVQEKRNSDIERGHTEVADIPVTQEFANRVKYIIYREFDIVKDNQNGTAIILTAEIKDKNGKTFIVDFLDPQTTSDDQSIILFPRNKALLKGDLKKASSELNISAQIKKTESGRYIVTLIESSLDDKKNKTVAEVNALIVLNEATATVNSTDENLLKMKDAVITTRATQLYISDDSVLNENKIKNIASPANRIVIEVSKDDKNLYSFLSLFNEKNSAEMFINIASPAIKDQFNTNFTEMNLSSPTSVLNSDLLNLSFINEKEKVNDSVILHLGVKEEKEEEVNTDSATATDAADSATTATATSDASTTNVAPVRQFDDAVATDETPLTMPAAPAKAVAPDFSNVISSSSTVPAKPKTTSVIKPAALVVKSKAKTAAPKKPLILPDTSKSPHFFGSARGA